METYARWAIAPMKFSGPERIRDMDGEWWDNIKAAKTIKKGKALYPRTLDGLGNDFKLRNTLLAGDTVPNYHAVDMSDKLITNLVGLRLSVSILAFCVFCFFFVVFGDCVCLLLNNRLVNQDQK